MFVRRKTLPAPQIKSLPMHRKLAPTYEHPTSPRTAVESFLADYLGTTGALWQQAMREVDRRGGPTYFIRMSGEPNTALLERLVYDLTSGRQGYAQKKLVRKTDSAGRHFCYDDAQGAYHRVACGTGAGGGGTAEQGGEQGGGKQSGSNKDETVKAGGYEYKEPKPDGSCCREHDPPPAGEKLAKANGPLYMPDPTAVDPRTGVPCCARVGLPAMMVPPPPKKIPRLPNLTDKEREVEDRFASAYENDPDGVVGDYDKGRNHLVGYEAKGSIEQMTKASEAAKAAGLKAKLKVDEAKGTAELKVNGEREQLDPFMKDNSLKGSPVYEIGDAPHIFNTDDVKLLSPDYNPQGVSEQDNKNAKGFYNSAVFQTANAIAKKAFLKHLDEVVAKLPDGDSKKTVLVTSGGCAAGKGYALKNIPETAGMLDSVGAVWDAAGELNGVENPWILEECRKRGIKPIFAFIHADPVNTWENPERGVVERAGKVGRMVDARAFADSYALGAQNFKKFMDKHIEDPNVDFHIIDNATGGKPSPLQQMPEKALNQDGEKIYQRAVQVVEERENKLSAGVVRGALAGGRIWGKPAPESKSKEKRLPGFRHKALPRYGSKDMAKEKDPAFKKLSDSLLAGMLKNLEANDANADEIDEERFRRDLQVKPLDVPEAEVKKEEQAPTEEPTPVAEDKPVAKKRLKDLRSKYGKGRR